MIDDIEARLSRWAEWCARRDDKGLGYPKQSPSCRLMARSGGGFMAEIDAEAWETEQAVQSLPEIHRIVVRETYLHAGTVGMRCKRLGVAYHTMAKYLEQAHKKISDRIFKKCLDRDVQKTI